MAKDLNVEERVEKLEARNRRVEGNKAWETSWTRRLSIMILIYLTIVFYLHFVIHINPWINGLVPVIGYFISTLTISKLKNIWIQRYTNK
jgi:hypothetical protein